MASFISTLSICILVLSNGCFALPILDGQLSTSTYSSVFDDVTTGETLNLRLLADDETSILPDLTTKQPTDEHMGLEMTTSISALSEEKTAQALRSFNQFSTSEFLTFTTESPSAEKREVDASLLSSSEPMTLSTEQSSLDKHEDEKLMSSTSDPFVLTTEQSHNDKVDHDDSLLSSSEPMIFTTEQSDLHQRNHEDSILSTSESMTLTTESSDNDEHKDQHLSTIAMESMTQVGPIDRRNLIDESENESENGTQQMQVELTTNNMLSSAVPEISTPKSSTSTEKYIGYLKYKNENEEEYPQERPTKSTKIQGRPFKKSAKKSNKYSEEENSEEITPPTAVFDQKALDDVVNIPNDFLVLDEKNDLVVTILPQKIFSSTMDYKEKEALNQGKEWSHPEEKESDH